jgi:hypothetical protein
MASSERAQVVEPAPAKCVRCSREIADDASVVFEHGDLFHHACWVVIMSEARTANLRQVAFLAFERLKRGR